MKSRQEIKLQAKINMEKQRGTAILILLTIIVTGVIGGIFGQIPYIGWLISLAVSCVAIVVSIGANGAYVSIYQNVLANVNQVISSVQVNFLRKLGGTLWMALWVFLWSLLLIVPGIVKAISYSMTPYILAECPNVPAMEALKLSMRMTEGHKGKLFVAGLSFIGWILLSALTLYILYIVHVGPYMEATFAGYYLELRNEALRNGVIRPEELGLVAVNQQQ